MKEQLMKEIEAAAKDLAIFSSELVKNESMVNSLLDRLHCLQSALYWYNKAQ